MEYADFIIKNITLHERTGISLKGRPDSIWKKYRVGMINEEGDLSDFPQYYLGDLLKLLLLFSDRITEEDKKALILLANNMYDDDSNWGYYREDLELKTDHDCRRKIHSIVSNYYNVGRIQSLESFLWIVLENYVFSKTPKPYQKETPPLVTGEEKKNFHNGIEEYFLWYINIYIPHLMIEYLYNKIKEMSGEEPVTQIPELHISTFFDSLNPVNKSYVQTLFCGFIKKYELPLVLINPSPKLNDQEFNKLYDFYYYRGDKDVWLEKNVIHLCEQSSFSRYTGSTEEQYYDTLKALHGEFIGTRHALESLDVHEGALVEMITDLILSDFFDNHIAIDLSDSEMVSPDSTYYKTEFKFTNANTPNGLYKYLKMIYGGEFQVNKKQLWDSVRARIIEFCSVWQIPYRVSDNGATVTLGSLSFDLELSRPGLQYYSSQNNFKMLKGLLQCRANLVEAANALNDPVKCGEYLNLLEPLETALKNAGMQGFLIPDEKTLQDENILKALNRLKIDLLLSFEAINPYTGGAIINYYRAFAAGIPGAKLEEKESKCSGGHGPLHRATPITVFKQIAIKNVNIKDLILIYREEKARLDAVREYRRQYMSDERILDIKPVKTES